jgi:hypothetical protein
MRLRSADVKRLPTAAGSDRFDAGRTRVRVPRAGCVSGSVRRPEERHLAALLDQVAATEEEFEAVAYAVEYGAPDSLPSDFAARYPGSEILEIVGDGDRDEGVLDGLEIGVAGLSYALSSIGCFPAASCRSHSSGQSWSRRPVVYFAAERPTVHWLTPMVRDSGCGFGDGSGHGDLLFVQAPSITNLMDLADRIITTAERQSYNR